MKTVGIREAMASLSSLLARVEGGETIVICRRNGPVAELRSLPQARRKRRPIGLIKGFRIPPAFFEPLPEEAERSFKRR